MVGGSGITIEAVGFTIGDFSLKEINIDIPSGEYFVLTGPNGAGKTMLLKIIAGLEQPDSGEVFISGKNVTTTPPWERQIGYVPQDYALFPNRTVRRNISFGLEVRKFPKKRIAQEVEEIANLVGIDRLLNRTLTGLSGGEQQKVSIARALVLKPSVLLLDEPVSSIDEKTRDSLCKEFKNIQQKIKVTTIHVSHNKRETGLVADRIGVLENGRLINVFDNHRGL